MMLMIARSSLAVLACSTAANCLADTPIDGEPVDHRRLVTEPAAILSWRLTPALGATGAERLRAVTATPLLDHQLADRDLISRLARRRAYRLELGSATLGMEMLRLQSARGGRFSDDRPDPGQRKSWSLGLHADWLAGSRDRFSVGLANGTFRNLLPGAFISDPHHGTRLRTLAMSWTRDEHWRFGWGWQQSSGRLRRAEDRIVQLADGAPLHETGMTASLAFMPGGDADPRQNSFGIETRRASVAADDLAVVNSAARADVQARLFIRTRF